MKKLLLIGCFVLFTLAEAKIVNGIALIVNGEAVTTAEIRAVQNQMHVSKKQATDMLIADRLQKAAMRNVSISEDAIDSRIAHIATQNNLTVPKMQKILKQQGTTWSKYRSSIRHSLKKEKFYQEKVVNNIPTPTTDELKLFYKNHKKEFFIPSSISLIEYSAKTEEALKNFLRTKNKKGIKSRSVKKSTKTLNPSLLTTILQTQNGSYTRPLNAGDKFISYKVLSKSGKTSMPFEAAQGMVSAKWKQKQQGKALKDYFEKLRTNADIQMLR